MSGAFWCPDCDVVWSGSRTVTAKRVRDRVCPDCNRESEVKYDESEDFHAIFDCGE